MEHDQMTLKQMDADGWVSRKRVDNNEYTFMAPLIRRRERAHNQSRYLYLVSLESMSIRTLAEKMRAT